MEENYVKSCLSPQNLQKIKVIVSDIEGTTTSIPFVRNTLKSFWKNNLHKYLNDHWKDTEIQEVLLDLKAEKAGVSEEKCGDATENSDILRNSLTKEEFEEYLLENLDLKQSIYSLKLLVAKIWEEGFSSNRLRGHLFPDVIPAFREWKNNGISIYLYSSGIEYAQKLIFTHSNEGNVLELISGCFDLSIGSKVQSDSYTRILAKVDCKPEDAAFITDNVDEADAARKAGMLALLVQRDGNEPFDDKYLKIFPTIHSFDEITKSLCERKKIPNRECEDVVRSKKPKLD